MAKRTYQDSSYSVVKNRTFKNSKDLLVQITEQLKIAVFCRLKSFLELHPVSNDSLQFL